MTLKLLPQNQIVTDLVDYTHGVITRHYKMGMAKYYFTLYPDHYSEGDALAHTGRYLAVVLTPNGLRVFYLLKNISGAYVVDNMSDEVNLQYFKNGNGYITMYAEALQADVNEKMNFIKASLKIMNQAIVEFKP